MDQINVLYKLGVNEAAVTILFTLTNVIHNDICKGTVSTNLT